MNRTRLTVTFVALLAVLSGWRLANALLIGGAVSPPRATITDKLRLAMTNKPYQVAVPHRTGFEEVRLSIVPEARACGTQQCDSTSTKATCNNNCRGMCGHCPDCWNGPCTIYLCVGTSKLNRLCEQAFNTDPHCTTCEDDNLSSGCQLCNGYPNCE